MGKIYTLLRKVQANGLRYPLVGGGENAILTEPASSHATCLKTRRLPPVGCTLCWASSKSNQKH